MGKLFAPIVPYLLGALAIAAIGLYVHVGNLTDENERLESEVSSLERSIIALEKSREQARLARDVADATAARLSEKAERYDRLRENLLKGGHDEPIPDFLADYVRDLLGGLRRGDPN